MKVDSDLKAKVDKAIRQGNVSYLRGVLQVERKVGKSSAFESFLENAISDILKTQS